MINLNYHFKWVLALVLLFYSNSFADSLSCIRTDIPKKSEHPVDEILKIELNFRRRRLLKLQDLQLTGNDTHISIQSLTPSTDSKINEKPIKNPHPTFDLDNQQKMVAYDLSQASKHFGTKQLVLRLPERFQQCVSGKQLIAELDLDELRTIYYICTMDKTTVSGCRHW